MQFHAGASAGSVYHNVTLEEQHIANPSCAYFHCGLMLAYPPGAECGQCAIKRPCFAAANLPRGNSTTGTALFCHAFEPGKARTHHLKSRASACGPCGIKVCLLHATYMGDNAKRNQTEPAARRGARRKQRTEEESLVDTAFGGYATRNGMRLHLPSKDPPRRSTEALTEALKAPASLVRTCKDLL